MRQQRVDNDSEIRMSMRDVRDRQTYIQRERGRERGRERERERAYGGREYETWANSQFYEGSRWLWGSIGARCWPAIDLPTVHRSVNSRSCWISERIARREWVGHKTSMLEKHGWYGVPNQNETRQQGLMSNKFYTICTTEDCKTSPERPMILPCLPPTREKIENQKIHPRVATFQILHAILLGISNHYDFCNQNALKKIPTTCVGIRRFLDFHMANLMGQVQQEFDSNKLKYRPVSIKKTTRSIWRAIKLLRNQTSKFGEICTEAMLVHHRLQKQSRKKMPN